MSVKSDLGSGTPGTFNANMTELWKHNCLVLDKRDSVMIDYFFPR